MSMKKLLIVISICLLLSSAAIAQTSLVRLYWDAVTTDATGAPEVVVQYNVYSRDLGATTAWILIGHGDGS
jgi:hypothetical protein